MRSASYLLIGLLALCFAAASAPAAKPGPHTFVAPMDPGQEVHEVISNARGTATFRLSSDGTSLSYRVVTSRMQGVTMAHIHGPAPPGVNAGVVVWLFGPTNVDSQGILAEGTIGASDLDGALADEPLEALIEMMENGLAYVNVHTVAYPPGEIRGQIRSQP